MNKIEYFKQLEEKKAQIELLKATHITPIVAEITLLEKQMVDACPFKVGDKVLVTQRAKYGSMESIEDECFITSIEPAARQNSLWDCDGYKIKFAKVKRDGKQSLNRAYVNPKSLSHIRKAE